MSTNTAHTHAPCPQYRVLDRQATIDCVNNVWGGGSGGPSCPSTIDCIFLSPQFVALCFCGLFSTGLFLILSLHPQFAQRRMGQELPPPIHVVAGLQLVPLVSTALRHPTSVHQVCECNLLQYSNGWRNANAMGYGKADREGAAGCGDH